MCQFLLGTVQPKKHKKRRNLLWSYYLVSIPLRYGTTRELVLKDLEVSVSIPLRYGTTKK